MDNKRQAKNFIDFIVWIQKRIVKDEMILYTYCERGIVMSDLMQTDNLVQQVVERIADAIHPEKIILFGSRANGSAKPDSDIDLLILYDGPLSKREVKLTIRRLFRHPDFSMDLFVLTPDEYLRQQNVSSTLGYIAAREGVVCCGS